jgi:hypothetical protein
MCCSLSVSNFVAFVVNFPFLFYCIIISEHLEVAFGFDYFLSDLVWDGAEVDEGKCEHFISY